MTKEWPAFVIMILFWFFFSGLSNRIMRKNIWSLETGASLSLSHNRFIRYFKMHQGTVKAQIGLRACVDWLGFFAAKGSFSAQQSSFVFHFNFAFHTSIIIGNLKRYLMKEWKYWITSWQRKRTANYLWGRLPLRLYHWKDLIRIMSRKPVIQLIHVRRLS